MADSICRSGCVIGTEDDLHVVNELHILNDKVILRIQSVDVLHSFSAQCPYKQDMVPGVQQHIGSKPKRQAYLILCVPSYVVGDIIKCRVA